jgi:hypothetical protein
MSIKVGRKDFLAINFSIDGRIDQMKQKPYTGVCILMNTNKQTKSKTPPSPGI